MLRPPLALASGVEPQADVVLFVLFVVQNTSSKPRSQRGPAAPKRRRISADRTAQRQPTPRHKQKKSALPETGQGAYPI